jgi:hypothetical protein
MKDEIALMRGELRLARDTIECARQALRRFDSLEEMMMRLRTFKQSLARYDAATKGDRQ